ncbi:MAG TPA: glycosyltransferase family 2 protein, partial [Acidimicrobiia bacterium]
DPPAIVVGSKRAPDARDERSWPRRFVTGVFAAVLRVGFGLRVSDTHGMKALDRERVLALAEACRSDGELFDTELILRAERAGLGVVELPVTVAERRPSRTSITRRSLRTLAGLARLRLALARDRRPVP